MAFLVNGLAEAAESAGRLSEAESLMRRALTLASNPEADPIVLVVVLENFGALLRRLTRYEESEKYIRRGYELSEKTVGENHRFFARSLNNLGLALHEMKRYAEAEPMLLRSIKISERVYGSNHYEVAVSLNNLGRLLRETNRQNEAEKIFLQSIKIFERTLDFYRTLSQLAATYANLAHCYIDQNKLAEAEKAFRNALELDIKAYGRNHVEVARDMSNLGVFLVERGRYADADPLLRRSLKILQTNLGKDHELTREAHLGLELLNRHRTLFRLKLKK